MHFFYCFYFLRAAGASLPASVRPAPDTLLWPLLRAHQSENAHSFEVVKNVSEGLFFFFFLRIDLGTLAIPVFTFMSGG